MSSHHDEQVAEILAKGINKAEGVITELREAMLHLLEVQTAPSFTDGDDADLYKIQSAEWLHAVDDARRVYRKHENCRA